MADNAVASTSKDGAFAEPAAPTKKPRPKPKKKLPTGSIDGVPSAPPSDFAPAATTVPKTAITTAPSELIPEFLLPEIPLTIADRAKSRARNAKAKPIVQDIIDIPSDEDEQLLRLSPHRPKQKAVRGAKSRPIPNPPPPSSHPSQESLVTPTSDFQPAPAVSSQLPPSDPPSSTLPLPISTPESAKKRRQVPDADDESPPKKRKHQRVVTDDDDNDDSRTHAPPPRGMATFDPPPPNFFASSSSSLPPPPAPVVRGEPGKKKTVKRKQAADDPPPPEAVDSDPLKVGKSRPKPKKRSGVHPEPNEVGRTSSIPTTTSRSRSNAEAPVYKSAEIVDDSDEDGGSLVLPPPPRIPHSESPLSDLPETTGSDPSKPITPSTSRKRLVPEVVITTVPRKRTSSLIREVEKRGTVDKDGADESPKGKKRQKQAGEDYFVGLDEVEVVPKEGPKGMRKAPPKGKGRKKPQTKEPIDDEEFQEPLADDPADGAAGMSGKAKSKVKTKVTTKTKTARPNKSRILDSDNEATADAAIDETVTLAQDTRVSLGFVVSSPTISMCGLQEDQENTLPSPEPAKSKPNPPVTPSSVSRKTPAPSSASSFARLNYGHSLASEEKPMSMAEIIRKANSNTGTPAGIKPHSSLMKGSRSALKRIAPLHARRKTPPPLPPKPPPPKKTKKQLDLEEKWEEELEETIEGWAALSSQEREVLRKQKRDMEMGYED